VFGELTIKDGEFDVGGNLAHITTGAEFKFLGATDAGRFLTEVWGNPPQAAEGILGVLLPVVDGAVSPNNFAVIIEYDETGYVNDSDADSIDYDELLNEMQAATREGNEERRKAGYQAVELVGWAQTPVYDKAEKKMYWAKRLRFEGSERDTLNYNVRLLGRRGVLVLNVVAGIDELDAVNAAAPTILARAEFKTGETYAEFNPDVDQVAAYGLAGLVAGGVLTKTGFFKAALAALLAFKKGAIALLVAAFAGIASLIKRFFRTTPPG